MPSVHRCTLNTHFAKRNNPRENHVRFVIDSLWKFQSTVSFLVTAPWQLNRQTFQIYSR